MPGQGKPGQGVGFGMVGQLHRNKTSDGMWLLELEVVVRQLCRAHWGHKPLRFTD